MSELKGQLLGIILVLLLFTTITVSMKSVFGKMTTKIETQVTEVLDSGNTSSHS